MNATQGRSCRGPALPPLFPGDVPLRFVRHGDMLFLDLANELLIAVPPARLQSLRTQLDELAGHHDAPTVVISH